MQSNTVLSMISIYIYKYISYENLDFKLYACCIHHLLIYHTSIRNNHKNDHN